MHVLDSINQGYSIDLHQLYEIPPFESERNLVHWIRARVIDVMVHEVEEFFTLDGEVFEQPKHPLPGGL